MSHYLRIDFRIFIHRDFLKLEKEIVRLGRYYVELVLGSTCRRRETEWLAFRLSYAATVYNIYSIRPTSIDLSRYSFVHCVPFSVLSSYPHLLTRTRRGSVDSRILLRISKSMTLAHSRISRREIKERKKKT